jgi:AcrR family transcriptional regulator
MAEQIPVESRSRGPRPPQQARSLATRRRLLDATVAVLLDLGLAATSTPEVCRRAGVSQGALFKHFGSKSALLAAAVAHLFRELVDDYRGAFAAIADCEDRIGGAVQLLWSTFTGPRLGVAFELYGAARSDPELRAALAPVLEEHRRSLRREARALFPEAAQQDRDFDAVIDLILSAMQGAALGRMVLGDDPSHHHELTVLEALARREIEGLASREIEGLAHREIEAGS